MNSWIFNDITWCANSDTCSDKKCFRHLSNRKPESEPNIYSMAYFKDTENCPSYFEKEEENV